ncbi:hypothetical protein GCM10018793_40270 [Streptomyces sulfonofaciens]|uniref:Uncharacterized protein n=1 Tax=Streptomyces sulfonofaciens TaxID=68272 RepID=A0A919GBR3_9ACTN|nr:hypothetical protein [Streptomyces sulfonofaciens]GHH81862.1 hypothetical protein GCM10018793_40270 [Streptomyces sulfonofaciens]
MSVRRSTAARRSRVPAAGTLRTALAPLFTLPTAVGAADRSDAAAGRGTGHDRFDGALDRVRALAAG